MKTTNKVKYPQIDEGWWDNAKDVFKRAAGKPVGANRGTSERFIVQFIENFYNDLSTAIEAGQVDINAIAAPQQPQQQPQQPQQQPQQPQQQPQQPQGQAMDLDAYKKRRESEKNAGIQAQQTAQAQMKQTAATNATRAAADNELVARVRAEKQKPGYQQDKGLIRQAAVQGIHERRYQKLNKIFESIVEQDEPAGTGQSVSQYLLFWVKEYLKNQRVDWSQDKNVQALAQQVQQTYRMDKGKKALNKLANYIYSASVSGQWPGTSATQSTTSPSQDIIKSIQSLLVKLKNTDPAGYDRLVKSLNSTPVGESRRRVTR